MSRTFRHCPNWALNRYEDWVDERSRGVSPYHYIIHSWEKAWSHGVRFTPTQRRPVLNDGNFKRKNRAMVAKARDERRCRRSRTKDAIRKCQCDDLPIPMKSECLN